MPVYVRIFDDPVGEIRRRVSEETGDAAREISIPRPPSKTSSRSRPAVDHPW